MVNWHRRVWKLEKSKNLLLYVPKRSNEIWFEPEVYTGGDVTIGAVTYKANCVAYRVRCFDASQVAAIWVDRLLFAASGDRFDPGKQKDGGPATPQLKAERLEASIDFDADTQGVLRVYQEVAKPPVLWANFDENLAGGSGWVSAH